MKTVFAILLFAVTSGLAAMGGGTRAASDTVAYGNTIRILTSGTGISSEESQNIASFIIRIDALIGWENTMFWTLRSTQSVGSGTLVPSLNLAHTGTMIGAGTTWSSDGATLSASGTNYVNTGWVQNNSTLLLFTAARAENGGIVAAQDLVNSSANRVFNVGSGGGSAVFTANTTFLSVNVGGDANTTFTTRTLVYNPVLGGRKTVNRSVGVGTVSFTDLKIPTSQPVLLGVRFNGTTAANQLEGAVAAFGGFNAPSADLNLIYSIHDIYRQTIGQGLGLP